jgi:glycosyltransferase involved in cell wall biosynthesis
MIGARPDVAVVIPTKNRVELLRRSVGCALAQRDVEIEIVVVDDGSEPALTLIPELVGVLADDRIRVVRHEKSRGVAAARNRGVEAATAPWVAFLDDDDLWAPDKLAAQLEALAADPTTSWSYTGEAILDGDLMFVWGNSAPLQDEILGRVLRGNAVPGGGSSVMVSRDVISALGGFDESFAILADWDLWTRLALRCRAAPVPDPLVGYVLQPGAMSRDVPKSRAEFVRMEQKHRTARSEHGTTIGLYDYLMYLADLDRRGGRRLRAVRLSLEAWWTEGSPRALAFAAATALWPGFGDAVDRRARAKYPPDLREAVDEWMAAALAGAGVA